VLLAAWADFFSDLAIGIVGVGGTVVGILLDRYLQGRGKILIHVGRWQLRYQGRDRMGGLVDVTAEAPSLATYVFTVDGFNSRNEPTGFREVGVEFRRVGRLVVRSVPTDLERTTTQQGFREAPDVELINLAPKQWVRLRLHGTVGEEELSALQSAEEVQLVGTDPKGKEHRFHIAKLGRHRAASAIKAPS
jgi:hypothetical protein